MPDESFYKQKIRELEEELSAREADLKEFRSELATANKQLESLIEKLQNEVKLAHQVQKKLVPTEYPNIQGIEFSTKFIPSMESGGDYFDIFEHDDRMRYGLVIAGASGHAMSALLLSVLLRFTSLMEARKGAEPHKVVAKVADEIVPSISGNDCADLFYAMIDRRTYEMEYCRAGEIIALVKESNSDSLELLESSTPPLGKDFNDNFKTGRVTLNPRDRLIVCTRGILEQQNLEGEAFGKERLFHAISKAPNNGVHELRNEVLLQLKKFTQGKSYSRDVTVFVQEVKDRVIKLAKK